MKTIAQLEEVVRWEEKALSSANLYELSEVSNARAAAARDCCEELRLGSGIAETVGMLGARASDHGRAPAWVSVYNRMLARCRQVSGALLSSALGDAAGSTKRATNGVHLDLRALSITRSQHSDEIDIRFGGTA